MAVDIPYRLLCAKVAPTRIQSFLPYLIGSRPLLVLIRIRGALGQTNTERRNYVRRCWYGKYATRSGTNVLLSR